MLSPSGGEFWPIPTTLLSILAYGSKKILFRTCYTTKICDTLNFTKVAESGRKMAKKPHKNSHVSTLWPQSHFGHYFFQYLSLAKPSNWLLVDEKKKKKKWKFFKKIDEILKKKFLNPRHGSKMASRILLNGSGVLFWPNFWVPDIIWQSWKPYIKFVNS